MSYLRTLVMGVCCVVVTGCMLDPQFRRDRFAETCAGYGFLPGTVAYAQCMQVEDIRWHQRFDASTDADQLHH